MRKKSYNVPENTKELESLTNRAVGVFTPFAKSVSILTFFNKFRSEEGFAYEFLEQVMDFSNCRDIYQEPLPIREIRSYISSRDSVCFYWNGVDLDPQNTKTVKCNPGDPGYKSRLKSMRRSKLWRKPVK